MCVCPYKCLYAIIQCKTKHAAHQIENTEQQLNSHELASGNEEACKRISICICPCMCAYVRWFAYFCNQLVAESILACEKHAFMQPLSHSHSPFMSSFDHISIHRCSSICCIWIFPTNNRPCNCVYINRAVLAANPGVESGAFARFVAVLVVGDSCAY